MDIGVILAHYWKEDKVCHLIEGTRQVLHEDEEEDLLLVDVGAVGVLVGIVRMALLQQSAVDPENKERGSSFGGCRRGGSVGRDS
ncbi:hypothetical protein NDU88_001639 [Pleurodeles waltl]|uniref:Uncharacterized protein n=1 Tax=Pleurodeles waltl TaxID=8319 RepID=A0AAV7SB02_PLEWA|nr:hypothetical protein NDU88_001639 [Pleurodeles waltl]